MYTRFACPIRVPVFHGIAAYRQTGRSVDALMHRVYKIDSLRAGEEICGADRPIGPIGLVLLADVSAVFLGDCWSDIGYTGQRFPTSYDVGYLTHADPAQYYRASLALGAIRACHDSREYLEAFAAYPEICGVFIKGYAAEDTIFRATADRIAREYGVPVHVVETGTSIAKVSNIHASEVFDDVSDMLAFRQNLARFLRDDCCHSLTQEMCQKLGIHARENQWSE